MPGSRHVWQLARQLYRGAGGDRLPRPAAAAAEAALRALHTAPSTWSLGAAPADALPDERLLRDDAEDAARSEVDVELDDSSEAAAAAAASAAGLPPPLPGVVRRAFSFQGQDWTLETGRLARLADGACTLRCGGTTVLAAVTCDAGGQPQRRPGAGGAPLQVDYREKLYAVGRIPGTYNKREGAPKEHELLAARRMERAVRALLPRGFAHPLDLDAAVLSADGGGDPEVLALNAASAALAASDVPWGGPFGAVRVALTAGGGLVVNPPPGTHHDAPLRLLVAATAERVVLLEVEGEEAAESEVVRAMRAGVAAARELLAPQLSLAEGTGRTPRQVALAGADPAAARRMAALARAAAARILRNPELDSVARGRALAAAKASLADAMRAAGAWRAEFSRIPGSGCVTGSDVDAAFGAAAAAEARAMAVDDGLRPDGRGPIDLRPLRAEAGHVPVVHGSALFEAGDTQALAALTVGSRAEQQRVESLLGGDASKRLFVHYSLPDYATPGRERGWPPGGSMRHDLDRSAFVERALVGALPPAADFPFTLRLNADALGADGGAAAAAVCAGSLAMAAAGVPSRGMVAAVSVGLASEGGAWSGEAGAAGGGPPGAAHAWPPLGRHELLTDPTAAEVAAGDMEFRVAGTAAGVTAAQLDACAPGGVPLEVLEAALGRAHVARLRVLAAMRQALPEARHAESPMFGAVHVRPAMLGRVMGREGSNVRAIESSTGARVDAADTGALAVFAPSAAAFRAAREALLAASGDGFLEGETYLCRVQGLKDYGAFLEFPGTGARLLLHISEIAPHKIRAVEDVLEVGQEVEVLCLGRDAKGNVRVSRRAALARSAAAAAGAAAAAAGDALGPDR